MNKVNQKKYFSWLEKKPGILNDFFQKAQQFENQKSRKAFDMKLLLGAKFLQATMTFPTGT